MENDASGAGVLHGGLFSTTEIRILVCYILSAIDEPIPVNMLVNVLHMEGIANGFEVSDAIVSLQNSGQLVQVNPENDEYTVTESGKSVAKELNSTLSMTVRERAYKATLRALTQYKNAKDTEFTITHENGYDYLTCTASDGTRPFISVKLILTDKSQANYIKERFLENPAEIFTKVIEMIIK